MYLFIMSLDTAETKQPLAVYEAFEGLEFGVRRALGVYKGQVERSLIIEIPSTRHVDYYMDIARNFQQESVLVVSPDNSAELYYTNGGVEPIGTWTKVDKIDPEGMTIDLSDMSIYTVKKG